MNPADDDPTSARELIKSTNRKKLSDIPPLKHARICSCSLGQRWQVRSQGGGFGKPQKQGEGNDLPAYRVYANIHTYTT